MIFRFSDLGFESSILVNSSRLGVPFMIRIKKLSLLAGLVLLAAGSGCSAPPPGDMDQVTLPPTHTAAPATPADDPYADARSRMVAWLMS